MAGLGDFTNQFISGTYHRVLQLFEGVVVDGTGSSTDLIVDGNLQVNGNILGLIQSASYVPIYAGIGINVNYLSGGISISSSATGSSSTVAVSAPSFSALYANNGNISGSPFITIPTPSELHISGALRVSQSLDTDERILYDIAGSTVLDWNNRILYASTGQEVFAFDNGYINDLNGIQVVDLVSHLFYGTASFATTASYIPLVPGPGIVIQTEPSGIAISSSVAPGGSQGQFQFNSGSQFGGFANLYTPANDILVYSGSFILTGSLYADNLVSDTLAITTLIAAEATIVALTGSLLGTSSYAVSASYVNLAQSASYLDDPLIVRGEGILSNVPYWTDVHTQGYSALETNGNLFKLYAPEFTDILTIDAQTLGDLSYGLTITGSLRVSGSIYFDGGIINATASYATTASYIPKQDTLVFNIEGDSMIPSGSTLYGCRYVPGEWTITGWTLMSKNGSNIELDVQSTTLSNFTGSYTSLVSDSLYPKLNGSITTQSMAVSWSPLSESVLSIKVRSNYGNSTNAYLFIHITQ